MDRDHEVVFSVSHGQNRQWTVTTRDSAQPLASFADPHTACAWAIARAKPSCAKVFIEKRAANAAGSAPDRAPAADLFEYSIPVTWTESAHSRVKSARR